MRVFNWHRMHSIKLNHLLAVLFLLFIFIVPLTYLVGENSQTINWVEGRRMVGFELGQRGFVTAVRELVKGDPASFKSVINEQFVNRAIFMNIEAAASDQIPLRLPAIQTAKAVDRLSIQLAYLFAPDPAIPADMNTEFFIVRDYPVIIPGPERFKESTLGVIDDRINNYQILIEANPEINFYAYHIERIQNSKYHPLYTYFDNLDGGQFAQYFRDRKPEGLNLGEFTITRFEDHLRFYYQTDHHLNASGILLAYHQIHALLSVNFPEISPARDYNRFIGLSGVEFHGTASRKAFHPLKETIFEVFDYALPPHHIYEYGQEITYGNSADYLAGIYPNEPYFNHYEGYFGGDKGLIEFVFENQVERNLLVIGNSYDNALLPLLATHYQHTYSVDVRYFTDFSLSAFLETYRVDDILIVGEDSVVFKSRRYQINP